MKTIYTFNAETGAMQTRVQVDVLSMVAASSGSILKIIDGDAPEFVRLDLETDAIIPMRRIESGEFAVDEETGEQHPIMELIDDYTLEPIILG